MTSTTLGAGVHTLVRGLDQAEGGMAAHRFVSRIIPAAEPAVMVIGKQRGGG